MSADRRLKRRLSKFATVRLVNPLVRPLLERARLPGWALLETRGRRTGLPRRVPLESAQPAACVSMAARTASGASPSR